MGRNRPHLVTKPLLAALSFVLPAGAAILRPLGLDAEQCWLLGTLVQVILAWSASLTHRDIASAYLILSFLFIGKADFRQVLNFPLSPNFVLIVSSFLLSAAIVKSGLADRLAHLTFSRFARSPRELVRFSFVAGAALIFLIPQPFPRVIIMASLYSGFLARTELPARERSVLLLSVFVASTTTSMLFLNGDIVLNNAALGFAGVSLGFAGWIEYMFLPSAAVSLLAYVAFVLLFRVGKEPFASARVPSAPSSGERSAPEGAKALTRGEIKVAVLTVVVILLWLTEPIHSISAAWSAAIVVVALYAARCLEFKDLKEVNLSLILFLTAAFAIGKVLDANGIAAKLNEHLCRLLPPRGSAFFFPTLALLVMALHLLLGSSITTLSVLIPSLVETTAGLAPPIVIALLAYTAVNMQYFFPIHHVTIMIGAGRGYYSQRETLRFGLVLVPIVLLSVSFLLIPWWKLIGAL
jgi:sodium-dependent dicarboxylate transporter 2/3/5